MPRTVSNTSAGISAMGCACWPMPAQVTMPPKPVCAASSRRAASRASTSHTSALA
ncbi:MAG: hypothetical protein MI824_07620 [Hyphomicrobiales bacterium]|nr:hypothetical protein [Hyphomicrobiales bacterium]